MTQNQPSSEAGLLSAQRKAHAKEKNYEPAECGSHNGRACHPHKMHGTLKTCPGDILAHEQGVLPKVGAMLQLAPSTIQSLYGAHYRVNHGEASGLDSHLSHYLGYGGFSWLFGYSKACLIQGLMWFLHRISRGVQPSRLTVKEGRSSPLPTPSELHKPKCRSD